MVLNGGDFQSGSTQNLIDPLDLSQIVVGHADGPDLEEFIMNIMPKIALGAWSWGAGAAGGDQVFGSHLFEDDLRPVFDKAMEIFFRPSPKAAQLRKFAGGTVFSAMGREYPHIL